MGCNSCEIETKSQDLQGSIAYVRVGNGNVAIIGCRDHLRALIEKLRSAPEQPALGGEGRRPPKKSRP